MLQTRIKTAFVLLGVLLLALAGGSWSLALLACIAVVIAMYELYAMSSGLSSFDCARFSTTILIPVAGFILDKNHGLFLGLLLAVMLQIFMLIVMVEKNTHQPDYRAIATSLGLGLLYPGIFGLCLIVLTLTYPPSYCFPLLLAVAAADIGAYFAGRAFGGPHLAPRLSPKKTVSGAIAGLLCASLAMYLFHVFAMWEGIASVSILLQAKTLLIGLAIGVTSIFGDLMASLCKRAFEVKDSGSLLPGHGGVLDRIDGLLLAAPVMLFILS